MSGRGCANLRSPIVIREGVGVDASGMWNKGRASYPGRPAVLPGLGFGATGGGTGPGVAHQGLGPAAEAEGQRRQERCPASVEQKLSGLLHDRRA